MGVADSIKGIGISRRDPRDRAGTSGSTDADACSDDGDGATPTCTTADHTVATPSEVSPRLQRAQILGRRCSPRDPELHEFMKPLGGCTANGKIFWHEEEKQVASLILGAWLDPGNRRRNQKAIVVGSPGVGKSTMLCLLAFYVVLKCRKSVLVYRRLGTGKQDQRNCLLYVGYDNDQVVYFAKERCTNQKAALIYEALIQQFGISNVWLLLDGLVYRRIPEELETFALLTTSYQVDLKSSEAQHAFYCLHPCWKKDNLVKLARLAYGWDTETAEDHFFFSGGNVREFLYASTDDIAARMVDAVSMVIDSSTLYWNGATDYFDVNQGGRLRRTFVRDPTKPEQYCLRLFWEQVVDSEFAVHLLSDRMSARTVQKLLEWAQAAGP